MKAIFAVALVYGLVFHTTLTIVVIIALAVLKVVK
jgi:hypothetical protein